MCFIRCDDEAYVCTRWSSAGDFHGDGVLSGDDPDAMKMASCDAQAWNSGDGQGGGGWGEAEGINLLGVGDCNNDGLFNNFDIDCLADVIVAGGSDCDDGGERIAGDEIDVEHLHDVVRRLYDFFGMI